MMTRAGDPKHVCTVLYCMYPREKKERKSKLGKSGCAVVLNVRVALYTVLLRRRVEWQVKSFEATQRMILSLISMVDLPSCYGPHSSLLTCAYVILFYYYYFFFYAFPYFHYYYFLILLLSI